MCPFYTCFPPVIVVERAPPIATAHYHHRSSWAVRGNITVVVIAFLTIYNGLFTYKRNIEGHDKRIDDKLPLGHTPIPNRIAKRKEGTSRRGARKTESNADAAESQQSVSSTPESKEEESQETEVE
ncbi:hypothetical protein CRG98_044402 [Punica granatum]|uniref:Uncharacterized protein n=1 Tax=Punica granatum TaxID=22663 RepID=A0A2I0HVD7_PUNGR|nr:hypothetical protein CRG98_044402 [Punica granatum]